MVGIEVGIEIVGETVGLASAVSSTTLSAFPCVCTTVILYVQDEKRNKRNKACFI